MLKLVWTLRDWAGGPPGRETASRDYVTERETAVVSDETGPNPTTT